MGLRLHTVVVINPQRCVVTSLFVHAELKSFGECGEAFIEISELIRTCRKRRDRILTIVAARRASCLTGSDACQLDRGPGDYGLVLVVDRSSQRGAMSLSANGN